MRFVLLSSLRATLPAGWTRERVLSLFGSVGLDLSEAPPGPGATLSVFTVLGPVRIVVERGSQIDLRGSSILGSRRLEVEPGQGSNVVIDVWTILASVRIEEASRQ
jgi:hypothetical protein